MRIFCFYRWSFLGSLAVVTVGCVGPTTPFGAIHSLQPESAQPQRKTASLVEPKPKKQIQPVIQFFPKRQVLHDRTDFVVQVTDAESIPDDFELKVLHDGRDVTSAFLQNSKVSKADDQSTITYRVKDFRLRVDENNEIQFAYRKGKEKAHWVDYKPPSCSLFERKTIRHSLGFHQSKDYMSLIEEVSQASQYNPGFLAGIVAQESGFNPQAVSWAKAIGLTQITPLAEKELINRKKGESVWPRFPGINKMHYLQLKTKILTGEIDHKKEWRLNPRYSLQGGATYISYLKRYWSLPNNEKIVRSLPGDYRRNLSEVILASYNSGAARVKAAIVTKSKDWKKHRKLKEANKYVKKVSSYCYHFSTEDNG